MAGEWRSPSSPLRRVLERYGLNPTQLGLPLRPGAKRTGDDANEALDEAGYEQPLLDFGDATGGHFFPGTKAASVASQVPFGERAGRRVQTLRDPDLAQAFHAAGWSSTHVPPPLVVNASGFSLHAATLIPNGERDRLERLCRYVTRPALCLKHLQGRGDGQFIWSLRRPWRDGTKSFFFTPLEFIAKLAALVPQPREHQLTYYGVLAPASPLRDEVVPRPAVRREPGAAAEPGVAPGPCTVGSAVDDDGRKGQRYLSWAELLKRVFRRRYLALSKVPRTAAHDLGGHRSRDAAESVGGCKASGQEARRP